MLLDINITMVTSGTRRKESLVGHRILVAIDSWPSSSKYPLGHFVQVGDWFPLRSYISIPLLYYLMRGDSNHANDMMSAFEEELMIIPHNDHTHICLYVSWSIVRLPLQMLGKDGDKAVETQVLLHEFDVPHESFTQEVMACLPPDGWGITEEGRRTYIGL